MAPDTPTEESKNFPSLPETVMELAASSLPGAYLLLSIPALAA